MSTDFTPAGYPFPLGDDPVSEGDNRIRDLAEAIDTQLGRAICSGTRSINVTNGTGNSGVTFPAGLFTAPPVVVVTARHGFFFGFIVPSVPPTVNGAQIGCQHYQSTTTSATIDVDWIAFQPSPGAAP